MNDIRFVKVYDLRDDHWTIEHTQQGTLSPDDHGLKLTHGLFATEEWWNAIEFGRLPKYVIGGYISSVYMGSMGDFPMFEISSESGKSRWARLGKDDNLYEVGKRVRLTYVLQEWKNPAFVLGPHRKVVIMIEIEA